MLHKSATLKLRFAVLSPTGAAFVPLQLPVPFSFTATPLALSLFVFVIEFTSSTSQSFFVLFALNTNRVWQTGGEGKRTGAPKTDSNVKSHSAESQTIES